MKHYFYTMGILIICVLTVGMIYAYTDSTTSYSMLNINTNQNEKKCDNGICKLPTAMSTQNYNMFNLPDENMSITKSIVESNKQPSNCAPTINSFIDKCSKNPTQPNYVTNGTDLISILYRGEWVYFSLGMWVFGLLLAFTPCVLPLFILMASFLGQCNEISYTRSILLCLVYIFSLAATLAVIGILAASGGIGLSAYFQNPWLIVIFSITLAALASSLLGFYRIKLPFFLQHYIARHNKLQSNYHFLEVAFMGVLGTLITSPCIAAPLVGLIAYISQSENILIGALGFFLFGLGLGTPLFAAVVFDKKVLPAFAPWQDYLRFFLGVVLMSTAIWILGRVIPYTWNMLIWSMLVIFTANYMLSMVVDMQMNSYILLWKTFAVLLMTFGVIILIGLFLGTKSPFNPLKLNMSASTKVVTYYRVTSLQGLNSLLDDAKSKNHPVIIIFDADWCNECHVILDMMSDNVQIRDLLDSFTVIEIDLTKPGSRSYAVASYYRISGTPTIIFYDATGNLSNIQLIGDVKAADFATVLTNVKYAHQ